MAKSAKVAISLPEDVLEAVEMERKAKGESRSQYFRRAILKKLEDDIDAREGLAVLGEVEDTIPLKDYLESQKESQRV